MTFAGFGKARLPACFLLFYLCWSRSGKKGLCRAVGKGVYSSAQRWISTLLTREGLIGQIGPAIHPTRLGTIPVGRSRREVAP